MTKEANTSYGTTFWAFKFDGDEANFRVWEGRTLALAEAKGFLTALTKVSPPGLMPEEYEDGEVVETSPSDSGAPSQIIRTRPCTSKEIRKYQSRTAANTYLFSSCEGKAYALIERFAGDSAHAWEVLKEK